MVMNRGARSTLPHTMRNVGTVLGEEVLTSSQGGRGRLLFVERNKEYVSNLNKKGQPCLLVLPRIFCNTARLTAKFIGSQAKTCQNDVWG